MRCGICNSEIEVRDAVVIVRHDGNQRVDHMLCFQVVRLRARDDARLLEAITAQVLLGGWRLPSARA